MRRRIKKFGKKIFDNPGSSSLEPLRSPSVSVDGDELAENAEGGLGDGFTALQERHSTIEHEALKTSVTKLLQCIKNMVDTGDTMLGPLRDLDKELQRISEICVLVSENQSTPQEKINNLARYDYVLSFKALLLIRSVSGITSAIFASDEKQSQEPTTSQAEAPDNPSAILNLLGDLCRTIDKFHEERSIPLNSSQRPYEIRKPARAISGRVAGALAIVKESLDGVPVLGLKAAVGGVLEALKAANRLMDNEDDVLKLVDHIHHLVKIATPNAEIHADNALQRRLDQLIKEIQNITIDIEKLQKQDIGSKFLGSADNALAITGFLRAVDQAIVRFQISGGIAVEMVVKDLGRNVGQVEDGVGRVESGVSRVEAKIESMGEGLDRVGNRLERMDSRSFSQEEETALNAIQPRSDNARYNSSSQTSSSFCLPDTRIAVLGEISQWARQRDARPIFWLCGMAGTGKTTITRTAAKEFDESGILGASFFFSRDEDDRRNTSRVFPTIAYQIARFFPAFRSAIIAAANADVCTAMMRTQLQRLIVEPIQSTIRSTTNVPLYSLVILFDALDECANENQIIELLVLLSEALRDLRPHLDLKIMVTGRPEAHVRAQFEKPVMRVISSISYLHDIDKAVVSDDILRYLNYHLEQIKCEMLSKDASWPREDDVRALVSGADGLFIYASVAVAYIRRQPVKRMEILLAGAGHQKAPYAFKHLDLLYDQIIKSAVPEDLDDDPEEFTTELRNTLGAIVVLFDPLSSKALEDLLCMDDGTVKPYLKPFHSVLTIPDSPHPIRIYHKSFSDFLIDRERCGGDSWFYINPELHHTDLAFFCLFHMTEMLEKDMCGVGDKLNSDIKDREGILNKCVSPHLFYACLHWASHLQEADYRKDLEEALVDFCVLKLLCWLEIMSLAGRLNLAIQLLNKAIDWCIDLNDFVEECLHDYLRFVLFFQEAISYGPSHIYQSALPFAPDCTPFTEERVEQSVRVNQGLNEEWNNILFVLKGHSSEVKCAIFSPDGSLIATGSSDRMVALWDARTGILVHILRSHFSGILSLAFSPDSTQLVSCSHDRTIIVWDVSSGFLLNKLQLYHNIDSPRQVAFLPNGEQVYVSDGSSKIEVWDVATGYQAKMFIHERCSASHIFASALAFSPDGKTIVFCKGKTAVMWDLDAAFLLKTLEGHSDNVTCVTFSPSGAYIASGSKDHTAMIWDANAGGDLVMTLDGHSSTISAIAFSSDDTQVASGSKGHNVAVWDIASGDCISKLSHPNSINTVMFSPDNNQIIAAGGTITLVWDTTVDVPHKTDRLHSVKYIAISLDGSHVATANSKDTSVRIWEAKTGNYVKKVRVNGEKPAISALALSPNGTQVVAAACHWITSEGEPGGPSVIMFWDINAGGSTGSLQALLSTQKVTSLAFSQDGIKIASGTAAPIGKGAIQIWDTRTGALINKFDSLLFPTTSLAFSPDGSIIATGSVDHGSIALFNAENGTLIHQTSQPMLGPIGLAYGNINLNAFQNHVVGRIRSVTFSSDGELVFSTDAMDHTICWDAKTLQYKGPGGSYGGRIHGNYAMTGQNSSGSLFLQDRWVSWRNHETEKKLCVLMPTDITVYASSGAILAFGTKQGDFYILDFSSCA
ncbi:hypothetical protein FRC03_010191 [Tulasnella sp. 419]|nr:hypothetical protein FRC03_010191 [Tulasnella sp. 419]